MQLVLKDTKDAADAAQIPEIVRGEREIQEELILLIGLILTFFLGGRGGGHTQQSSWKCYEQLINKQKQCNMRNKKQNKLAT